MFFNCAKFVVSFVISGVLGRILRAVNECLSETNNDKTRKLKSLCFEGRKRRKTGTLLATKRNREAQIKIVL